jgi:hypothetical protein
MTSSRRPVTLLEYLLEADFLPQNEGAWFDRRAGDQVVRVVCGPGGENQLIALTPRGARLYQAAFSPGTPLPVITAAADAAVALARSPDASREGAVIAALEDAAQTVGDLAALAAREAAALARQAYPGAAGLVVRYEKDGDLVSTAPDSITAPDGTRLWNAASGDGLPPGADRAHAICRIESLCGHLTASNKGGWYEAVEDEPGEDLRQLNIDAALRLGPAAASPALERLARATRALQQAAQAAARPPARAQGWGSPGWDPRPPRRRPAARGAPAGAPRRSPNRKPDQAAAKNRGSRRTCGACATPRAVPPASRRALPPASPSAAAGTCSCASPSALSSCAQRLGEQHAASRVRGDALFLRVLLHLALEVRRDAEVQRLARLPLDHNHNAARTQPQPAGSALSPSA